MAKAVSRLAEVVITERRESAFIEGARFLDRKVRRRLNYAVSHLFWSLDVGVGWSNESHENTLRVCE
jgi:hypothetical protein